MFGHIDYKKRITQNAQNIGVLDAKESDNKLVSSIVFVTLAESNMIDDATVTEHSDLFSAWEANIMYAIGDIRRYESNLYRCMQTHTAQADWTPDVSASLWKKIGDPTVEFPEWSQPIGAADAYMTGDKVSHNGKHWISTVDNNVWEPGVYGWEEAE